MGGGGGGGKGGGGSDRSAELYAKQQADLVRQKAETEEKERLAREEEQLRRDELRQQMLGQRNVLSDDDELATVTRNVLG